jgi:RecB family endonuclease NucS
MLLVDKKQSRLHPIPSSNLTNQRLLERADLQQMILRSADSFFQEMGESLKLLGEEVRPSEFIANRIDLLAIDPSGSVVIIELKRDKDRYQLL